MRGGGGEAFVHEGVGFVRKLMLGPVGSDPQKIDVYGMSRKHGDSTNDLTNGSKVTLIMVQNPEKTPPENVRKLNFGLRNMRLQNVESCSSQFSGLRASDCQSVVAQIIWSKIRRSWSFFSEPSFSLVSNMLFSSLDG